MSFRATGIQDITLLEVKFSNIVEPLILEVTLGMFGRG